MELMLNAALDATQTGLSYAIAFLGIWIAFRVHHALDLTVNGSFTLGAALTAVWTSGGGNPWLALLIGAAAGALAGLGTHLLHKLLRLRVILASIIMNTALLSINLAILGLPNRSLVADRTIVDDATRWMAFGGNRQLTVIVLVGIIAAVIFLAVGRFLVTEAGLGFRVSGINTTMARAMGISPEFMLLAAIVSANALCALSGSLVAQDQGFVDLHMGDSLIIFGITSVLLGETLVRGKGPLWGVAAVLGGSLGYRFLIALAFRAGVPPQLFNAVTAVIVVAAIAINIGIGRLGEWRQLLSDGIQKGRPPAGLEH